MNPITNVMKMYAKDKLTWLYLPWLILFFSFTVNLVIGFLTGGKEAIYTGGVVSIFIYMLVMGMVLLIQFFPFAIGLSVRRTDFFLGTVVTTVIVSAGSSIVLLLLSFVEQWTGAWGVKLHFFHLPYLNEGSVIEQLLIYFILMLNMIFLGLCISSVFRRFGGSGLIILFAIVFVLGSIGSFLCTYYGWWLDIFYWLSDHTAFTLSMWTVPLIVIYILVSFLFLRRATV